MRANRTIPSREGKFARGSTSSQVNPQDKYNLNSCAAECAVFRVEPSILIVISSRVGIPSLASGLSQPAEIFIFNVSWFQPRHVKFSFEMRGLVYATDISRLIDSRASRETSMSATAWSRGLNLWNSVALSAFSRKLFQLARDLLDVKISAGNLVEARSQRGRANRWRTADSSGHMIGSAECVRAASTRVVAATCPTPATPARDLSFINRVRTYDFANAINRRKFDTIRCKLSSACLFNNLARTAVELSIEYLNIIIYTRQWNSHIYCNYSIRLILDIML